MYKKFKCHDFDCTVQQTDHFQHHSLCRDICLKKKRIQKIKVMGPLNYALDTSLPGENDLKHVGNNLLHGTVKIINSYTIKKKNKWVRNKLI